MSTEPRPEASASVEVPSRLPDGRRLGIRPAAAGDVAHVREVEDACFSVPWGEGSFRSLLGLSRVCFLVAEVEGRVMGHGVLWWTADEGELANLAVHPTIRGAGVAGALLDTLLARARARGLHHVFLEVRVSNERALRLYRSRGFREVGIRRDYYRRPREDAKVLRLELDPASRLGHRSLSLGREGAGDDPHDTAQP